MYTLISKAHIPKLLKVLLYILLTLTCVYLIAITIYKLLEGIRKVIHWCSDKRNWWTFLVCIGILAIGSLLIAQYVFNLDPLGKALNWVKDNINSLRAYLGSLIGGAYD